MMLFHQDCEDCKIPYKIKNKQIINKQNNTKHEIKSKHECLKKIEEQLKTTKCKQKSECCNKVENAINSNFSHLNFTYHDTMANTPKKSQTNDNQL